MSIPAREVTRRMRHPRADGLCYGCRNDPQILGPSGTPGTPCSWCNKRCQGVEIIGDEAHMDGHTFDNMDEYSCSIPTGTTIGKRWRKHEPYVIVKGQISVWYMGEYALDPEFPETRVKIIWRKIKIVED